MNIDPQTRSTNAAGRNRLAQIDARLSNLRALFAITLLAVILAFVFGVAHDDPILTPAFGLGLFILIGCLTMRYKLVQEHDRISRQLSWLGLDRPKDEAELGHGPVHGAQPGFGAEAASQSPAEIAYFKTKPSTDRHQVASTASDQLL